MDDSFKSSISFYLRARRIHVFIETLRGIGSPVRICFMIDKDGNSLLMVPYSKRDFISHAVPSKVYTGLDRMEVTSLKLCRIIAGLHGWDMEKSYRVPGVVFPEKHMAVFNLARACTITRTEE